MKHVLVTNDFPPKIGGIQSLLWEWWRRLPPESFAVLTTPHPGAAEFDAAQDYRIVRTREPVLLPHPWMVSRIHDFAAEFGADFVVLDPALPLGLVGPALRIPYMVVLHGAEVTVPGRLPVSRQVLGRVLRGARHVIAAGGYPAREGEHAAGRTLPVTIVPRGSTQVGSCLSMNTVGSLPGARSESPTMQKSCSASADSFPARVSTR